MAHRTLINGTGYDISGGREMIGGTGYAKKGGRTLVNGTEYEIGFAKPVTIEITATKTNNLASVTIDGTIYKSAATVEVPAGTEIICSAEAAGSYNDSYGIIYLNDQVVARGTHTNVDAGYTYVAETDTAIELAGSAILRKSEIRITTK